MKPLYNYNKLLLVAFLFIISISVMSAGPKEDLLNLINQERANNNVPALAFDTSLNKAAQAHSLDMLNLNYFSHTSLSGLTYIERMNNAGFFGVSYGENIGWHTGIANATIIFKEWKKSPIHYANMLNSEFDKVGIGNASGYWPYKGYYSTVWTLDLGKSGCIENTTRQCGITDVGECTYGIQKCVNNLWTPCNATFPKNESCNNRKDDDCDGLIDEFCNCSIKNYTACYQGDVYWFDSCDRVGEKMTECGNNSYLGTSYCSGKDVVRNLKIVSCIAAQCNYTIIPVKNKTCDNGCNNGSCINCTANYTKKCFIDNNVYYYDSCGNRGRLNATCKYGCEAGKCIECKNHTNKECFNGDIYWFDSCGRRQEKKEECGVFGCNQTTHKCILCYPHNKTTCFGNLLYWMDSCGNREEISERCKNGCDNKTNKCILCYPHNYTACYMNKVFYFDSCGNPEDMKQDCGKRGCFNGVCNYEPCGDFDGDGYTTCVNDTGKKDCNDTNPGVNPGETEICGNKIDDNCNGNKDEQNCKENLRILPTSIDYDYANVTFQIEVFSLKNAVFYKLNYDNDHVFCRNTGICTKVLKLKEGVNNIYFEAEDKAGYVHNKTITVNVDTKPPRIVKQEPNNKAYANGNFFVTYTEDALRMVELYLKDKDSAVFRRVNYSYQCESGKNVECMLTTNLSKYDGQSVLYKFAVYDKFSSDIGKPVMVYVDTKKPVITAKINITAIKSQETTKTQFKTMVEINSSEEAKLEYSYQGSDKIYPICSSCESKTKKLTFDKKPEYVDIFATDKAGNWNYKRITFS